MKGTIAVAALAGGASAGIHQNRHAHNIFHDLQKKGADNSTCGCTTIYSTYYGEATLSMPPAPPATSTSVAPVTTSSTPVVVVVPTPVPQTPSTTGVYTYPATTITLSETTTVCGASSTALPSGTHTLGGVTTVIETATTVTCPYATVSTSDGVETSVIATTTTVCPSAGTYTIAPTTTTVPEDTTVTVPVVTSYLPGTYTQPELVTTVTETGTVIYCPFDIPTPTPSSTAVEIPATTPAPSSTIVPTPTEYPTESASSTSSSSSSASASATSSPGGDAGSAWAIAYTPYLTDEEGGCKSRDDVSADIKAITDAGVKAVRVYSTDCDTLPNVGDACKEYGCQMILGIFIDTPGCHSNNPTVSDQMDAISEWAEWDLVTLFTVGNEAVLHGYCTGQQIADLIKECKSTFDYSGPYTTAETLNVWEQEDFADAVCGEVDNVGINAHAFFNTATTASQAGVFVKGQIDIASSICGNKEALCLETGWPTSGNAMGDAVPGKAEQKEAIESIIDECGDKAVIFSYSSDAWKDINTPCACECAWGCAGVLGIDLNLGLDIGITV